MLVLLVLSVLGAATGELVNESMEVPPLVGTAVMMVLIGALAFYGSGTIAWFLVSWSFVLYTAYTAFFLLWVGNFGEEIAANFAETELRTGWLSAGVTYAGYNTLGAIAVLFSLRKQMTRREAILSGIIFPSKRH